MIGKHGDDVEGRCGMFLLEIRQVLRLFIARKMQVLGEGRKL